MSWTDLFYVVSLLLALVVAGIGIRLVITGYRPRSTAISVALGGVALILSTLANLSSFDQLISRLGQHKAAHGVAMPELEKIREKVSDLETRDGNIDQDHSQTLTTLQDQMDLIYRLYKRDSRHHNLNSKEMAKDLAILKLDAVKRDSDSPFIHTILGTIRMLDYKYGPGTAFIPCNPSFYGTLETTFHLSAEKQNLLRKLEEQARDGPQTVKFTGILGPILLGGHSGTEPFRPFSLLDLDALPSESCPPGPDLEIDSSENKKDNRVNLRVWAAPTEDGAPNQEE